LQGGEGVVLIISQKPLQPPLAKGRISIKVKVYTTLNGTGIKVRMNMNRDSHPIKVLLRSSGTSQ